MNSVSRAIRDGALYECYGAREIGVVYQHAMTPELLTVIQRFRGAAYETEGPVPGVVSGRNVSPDDVSSDHILLIEGDNLIGCARYTPKRPKTSISCVELGGFVVAHSVRQGRATLLIVNKVRELASLRGDLRFIARASVQFGSASILKKFGARVLSQYYEPAYRRDAELLEIVLGAETEVPSQSTTAGLRNLWAATARGLATEPSTAVHESHC